MQRVTRASRYTALPTPPASPASAGYFGPGDPAVPQPATVPGYEWFNMVQEELGRLVEYAGIGLSGADYTQLRQALARLFGGNLGTVSADTTLTVDHAGLVVVDATAASRTLTLPAANALGGRPIMMRIARSDGGGNTVTVQRAGSDNIANFGSSLVIPPLSSVTLISDGNTGWIVLGRTGVSPAWQTARSTQGIAFGGSYSGTQTVSFTAPADGYVQAIGLLNLSSVGSNSVTGTLSINGTVVGSDASVLPQSHTGRQTVTRGATVTVTMAVTTGTSPGINGTYMVAAQFVATP
jgi:hypothetical protein